MQSSAYIWAKIVNYLEEQYDPVTVSSWIDDAEIVEMNENLLILYSPDTFRRETIRSRYVEPIKEVMRLYFNPGAKLELFGPTELEEYKFRNKVKSSSFFNPQFTFDTFVVGNSNRFAHGACIAVTNNPGHAYNPLFIYGPAGVGKTHLLYAIANGFQKNNPNARIVYIKGDQFTNELISAIQSGNNVEFRSKYREADLFLVDDIQFIAGKESTQEEFFHTFNKLFEEHKQIVMTADRKPSEMAALEDRLRTRFEWGLMADVQPPDYETRMAIIKTKSKSLGLDFTDDVCNYIAVNITSNVRLLEGTVNKILAYHNLSGMPMDLPNISRAIADMFKNEGNPVPTPSLIISQVCSYYSIDEAVIRGTLKNRVTTEARQMAIYLIRKLTNLSLPDIGTEFSRDHTTILYAIRKMESALKKGDTNLQNQINDITSNINSCL